MVDKLKGSAMKLRELFRGSPFLLCYKRERKNKLIAESSISVLCNHFLIPHFPRPHLGVKWFY